MMRLVCVEEYYMDPLYTFFQDTGKVHTYTCTRSRLILTGNLTICMHTTSNGLSNLKPYPKFNVCILGVYMKLIAMVFFPNNLN